MRKADACILDIIFYHMSDRDMDLPSRLAVRGGSWSFLGLLRCVSEAETGRSNAASETLKL